MANLKLAYRYSKALLDLAIDQKKLDEVKSDIDEFVVNCDENRDLVLMLKSPIIQPSKKISIIDTIYKGRISELSLKFFHIVINKKRESGLLDIAKSFLRAYNVYKGIQPARVVTAIKISDDLKAKFEDEIKKQLNKEVSLITDTNKDIIGGFILKLDDNLYDASIAHQLQLLKKEFSRNDYIKKI